MKDLKSELKSRVAKGENLHIIVGDFKKRGISEKEIHKIIADTVHADFYNENPNKHLHKHWMLLIVLVLLTFAFIQFNAYEDKLNNIKWEEFDQNLIEDPVQVEIHNVSKFLFMGYDKEYEIIPKALFKTSSLLASKKSYYEKTGVSNTDIVLMWGNLANQEYENYLDISQRDRRYYIRTTNSMPYSEGYINEHSTNIHLIFANSNIQKSIQILQKNDVVYIEGYLVDVKEPELNKLTEFRTSMSRTDTGAKSSEVLFLTKVTLKNETYS